MNKLSHKYDPSLRQWLRCFALLILLLTGTALPTWAQLKTEGTIEGGFPMQYSIEGMTASNITKGGMFGNVHGVSADQVKFPVTITVHVTCTTPEHANNTCDKYRLCYFSGFQPDSYKSRPTAEGSTGMSVTVTENDLVEDTIWGDYSAATEGKKVRVKKYIGAMYVVHEMYDVSDGELEEMKKEGIVGSRQGLAAFASVALNVEIVIPIEVLGEKKKKEDDDPDRVEITVTNYGYDTLSKRMIVTGTYRSKTKITSATFFRNMGGPAVQGHINYGNNSFTAECDYVPDVTNQFKIVFDNEAQLSAEQTITMNADGTGGKQTTTDKSGNTTVEVPPPSTEVPGLGPVGNVPGPESVIKGIIGVIAPGLVGILGGLISGILGGGTVPPPPVGPKGPQAPPKRPEGPDDKKKPVDDKKKKEGKTKEQIEKEKAEKERIDAEKARKEAEKRAAKRREAATKAKKLLDDQEKANKELGSWTSAIIGTVKSAGADIKQGYHDVKGIVGPAITVIKDEAKSAIKDVLKNPGILVDTTIGTVKDAGQGIVDIGRAGKDIITHPIDIGWETVKGTASDVKTIAVETYGKAIVDMVKHPKKFVDFIYNASGGEDLIASMDPNRSLVDRSFHYGVAVYKTILNTMGARGLQQGGAAAAKALAIRGLTSTVQYGAARNAPVFHELYKQVDAMSKAGGKHLGVELNTTQKLKITTGLFLEWYKRRYDQ